jgi:hypothetical protein
VDTLQRYQISAGYQYTVLLCISFRRIKECFETLIILRHLKDKFVEREGKEND